MEAGISTSTPDESQFPCYNPRRIPKCLCPRERRPEIPEWLSVVHCHPSNYSSGTTSFLPQLEETYKNPPSVQDDAQFPCIASRAIPCYTSNKKGDLTSFMELQRVPKNTVTSLEGTWGHRSKTKELRVPQVNSRWGPIPLHWLQSHPVFPIKQDKWLDFL